MHPHRLVLNGPPAAVARLAHELRAAGAVPVEREDVAPPRLVWATARPAAVEALCARHQAVVVGLERFETLGEELERLVVHGRETTVLERRALAPGPGHDLDDDAIATPDGWGLCLDEDGEPLDRAALCGAAVRVVAVPVDLGPAPTGSSL